MIQRWDPSVNAGDLDGYGDFHGGRHSFASVLVGCELLFEDGGLVGRQFTGYVSKRDPFERTGSQRGRGIELVAGALRRDMDGAVGSGSWFGLIRHGLLIARQFSVARQFSA
jgi:hypothetical protein